MEMPIRKLEEIKGMSRQTSHSLPESISDPHTIISSCFRGTNCIPRALGEFVCLSVIHKQSTASQSVAALPSIPTFHRGTLVHLRGTARPWQAFFFCPPLPSLPALDEFRTDVTTPHTTGRSSQLEQPTNFEKWLCWRYHSPGSKHYESQSLHCLQGFCKEEIYEQQDLVRPRRVCSWSLFTPIASRSCLPNGIRSQNSCRTTFSTPNSSRPCLTARLSHSQNGSGKRNLSPLTSRRRWPHKTVANRDLQPEPSLQNNRA